MPEETPQKRVLPARERRESAAKRLARFSPAPPPVKKPATPASEPKPKRKYTKRSSLVQVTTPATSNFSPAPEDLLPTKLTSSKPLPTSRTQQPDGLSKKDYQSIAESAILAASLDRSRRQWLVDGIFKKYWTKPVKRKGVVDVPPDNPDVKSMTKLGNGQITIEPHKFEVTFYTVRDPQAPLPYYRHPNQHTSKPTPSTPTPFNAGSPAVASPHAPLGTPPNTFNQTTTPKVKQEINTPTHAPPKPKNNNDPVIHMLAQRAASDPRLKELMKVVATSKASQEQLKEFQKHIDEFNALVKKQDAERAEQEKEMGKETTPTAAIPQSDGPADVKVSTVPATTQLPSAPTATPTQSAFATQPTRPAPPYATYAPPPPPPRPEPIIKHIIVEFHGDGASPDRWIFPAYAALDIKYGGLEMLTSFFVERKGSEILASMVGDSPEEAAVMNSKWKADTEYYQAVTILVRANQHRTIETIARAAKTLAEVREQMEKVMKEKVEAPQEYLVHQLPRKDGQAGLGTPAADFVDSAVELGSDEEDDELKDFYGN